ncbi:MAG: N-formylglutamate deformylase [Acidobacteria bacterium]|nr:N-formylglutamate deformylase [Acidobacteriota bacterium]
MTPGWLTIRQGTRPLVVTFPHTGWEIPAEIEDAFTSIPLARKDTDWWVDQLYGFVNDMGATTIRTALSRSVIDANRDPSGASLYPGQATTELCPTTTFDGEPLYKVGRQPDANEIERRRREYFQPYHDAVQAELDRLRAEHGRVVLYDAHSIRSEVPRLFDGLLPVFNIGSNRGETCAPSLAAQIEAICASSSYPTVRDGRFRGGWTVRHYGQPRASVHAVQMELACRGYMDEPHDGNFNEGWPPPWNPVRAEQLIGVLRDVCGACLHFAEEI